MTSGAPWSVKGINPRAREIAKDLARRDGMTLGEWINRLILEDVEAEAPEPLAAPASGPRVLETPRAEPQSPARFEAAGHPADEVGRVASALDALSERIEAAERRSTSAIAGIDGSVRDALERLGESEREHAQVAARFEGLADEIKLDQARAGERVRRLEVQAEGPRSTEAVRELEGALGKLANRLYEEEARTSETLADLVRRVEEQEAREPVDHDALVEAVVHRIGERLETAQAGTSDALRDLASSFTVLDRRLRTVEGQAGPDLEQRFSRLSIDLAQRLESSRLEMAAKMRDVADGRFDRMEGKLAEMAGHVQAAEQRSALAMERMGREMVGLTDTLNRRVHDAEVRGAQTMEQAGARLTAAMEQRLGRADGAQAQALEKLGVEIARITERLAERIANAERRNALAIDDVGEQVARVTERLDQRQERGAADLAERIRLSEERTAKLLEEAREKIDASLARRPVEPTAAPTAFGAAVFGRSHAPQDAPQAFVEPAPFAAPGPFAAAAFPSAQIRASERTFEEEPFAPAEAFDPIDEFEPTPAQSADIPEAAEAPVEPEAFAAPETFGTAEAFEAPDAFRTPEAFAAPDAADAAEAPEAFEPAEAEELAQPDADEDLYDAAETYPETAVEAEPPRTAPLTTREVIEQARAAARAASANDGRGRKAKPAPSPEMDAPAPRSLFGAFSNLQKKRAGSTLKTMLIFSGLAAATGAILASYYLGVAEPGGGSAPRVREARNAAASPKIQGATAQAPATAANAAVALTTPAPEMAAATPRLAPAQAPPAPAIDPAVLYGDAVRRIEAKDGKGVDALRKAANQGYAPAQFYLAKLYENGEAGLKKDPAEARRWTERAAQVGDRKAMHNLGLYFFEGQGGPKNSTLAAQWFRRAADLGLVDSQYNLARLYEEGLGVSQNAAEAYKWYLIAAKNGDGESAKSAARVKSQLTAEAQAAAERSAIGFRPAAPNPSQTALNATPGGAAGVTTAQKALSKLGYYQGPQDGAPSPALKLAVAAYQRDQGISATGAIDADVLNRLQVFAR